MASETHGFDHIFTFTFLPNKKFTFLEDAQISELLMKWSMLGRISVQAFNFDQFFQSYMKNDFALDPCVKNSLQILDTSGVWKPLGRDVTHVDVQLIPCTKVSMDVFDPIFTSGIVHPSGHIAKCFHEVHTDFDELRMMLLEEDSDNYHVVSQCDRKEFLFRLFKHMVLGGELCQYEDVISPYIETAKNMYKDLVRMIMACVIPLEETTSRHSPICALILSKDTFMSCITVLVLVGFLIMVFCALEHFISYPLFFCSFLLVNSFSSFSSIHYKCLS
ncbi:cilia- and flagella-associated protein 300 isoform 2-T2 [Clarias gariepinus]|uniref:cilia- and flagella-associated protein 300 isoform X2 n=1 Tax=Clarias gariepinus TaxID=13013 RepID=UPI00234D794A|nr:cilia- and flagella-associated protein 300 isoform X2 [Clarias gariepinus]